MKATELKEKNVEELNAELLNLLREQFNLRMQHSNWPAWKKLTSLSNCAS